MRTDNGVYLFDAGMYSDGSDVRHLLQEMGSDVKDVRGVLMTHWHNDHAAGAKYCQEAGAKVYYHANEVPWMTGECASDGWFGALAEYVPEWGPGILVAGLLGNAVPRPVTADALVSEGDVIDGIFEVIETPGHTPGHLSFYAPQEKALFAGDTLAVVRDSIRFMAYPVTPDRDNARESMKKVLNFNVEVLCPGHRQPMTTGVPEASDRMLEYLRQGRRWPFFG